MSGLKAGVRSLLARAAGVLIPILPPKLGARLQARLAAYREGLRMQRKAEFWARASAYTSVLAVEDERGHHLLIDPSDQAIGRELFFNGSFEAAGVERLAVILRERSYAPKQVVDVGANIGTTTIGLMERFPDAGGFAFEPEVANVRLLRQNLLGNDLLDRVRVYESAASDVDGEAVLELSEDNPGDHRLRTSTLPGAIQEERRTTRTVSTVRLDTLVERGQIDSRHPGLLWIDAQGHEAHVLSGAETLRGWPTVVEFWPYGLKRSGGYERFLNMLESYAGIRNLRRATHEPGGLDRDLTVDQVDALGAAATRDEALAFTDLLLWPRELA